MMDKLQVIDGKDHKDDKDNKDNKTAPRPRHGLIRAVYDTIHACGGANITQIRKYLPAAIDDIKQVMRRGRLKSTLYNAVYNGYLIHDPKGYWRIASRSYYDARREYIEKMADNRPDPTDKTPEQKAMIYGNGGTEAEKDDYTLTINISKGFVMGVGIVTALALAFMLGIYARTLL